VGADSSALGARIVNMHNDVRQESEGGAVESGALLGRDGERTAVPVNPFNLTLKRKRIGLDREGREVVCEGEQCIERDKGNRTNVAGFQLQRRSTHLVSDGSEKVGERGQRAR